MGWRERRLLTVVAGQKKPRRSAVFENYQAIGLAPFGTYLGGANRDRTDDLYNAIVALSQLSYGPGKRGGRVEQEAGFVNVSGTLRTGLSDCIVGRIHAAATRYPVNSSY